MKRSRIVGLVLGAAERLGLSMPATEAAAALIAEEASIGVEEDYSAVIQRMQKLAEAEHVLPPAA
jgi:3-hydroxyisobutyrate dehydrogenase-like beta-hydroxyacid dehydrogenase